MIPTIKNANASHGGILVPFDMFRLSQLAAIFGDVLAGKARNIIGAKLVAIRHETGNVLLLRIEGSVVGDDAAEFWRGNADLALITSQALPHRVLMYWAQPGPPGKRREGFLFAQRGQMIASDEATDEQPRPDGQWPVTRLCEQMRLTLTDLAEGFPGSPRVEVSLMDASSANDQQLLMQLLGRDAPGAEGEGPAPASAPGPAGAPTPAGRPPAAAPPPRLDMEADAKRRASEAAAEAAEQQRKADAMHSNLPHAIDDLGVVSLPSSGLEEADLLRPLVQQEIQGDLPPGLPRSLSQQLQGKRADIAIIIEFLSEVFVENKPLSRPMLAERASKRTIGGRELDVLEVLAPRVGYGTLISSGKRHVFVSRKPEMPLPAEVVVRLLDGQ